MSPKFECFSCGKIDDLDLAYSRNDLQVCAKCNSHILTKEKQQKEVRKNVGKIKGMFEDKD